MAKKLVLVVAIVVLTVAAFLFAGVPPQASSPDVEGRVPALEDFHEVIYPIWHTAYPEKDIAALKGFVPQINELAAKVYAAKLPGILREKQGKWDAGVTEFRKAVDAYGAAAKGTDDAALLGAAEALHMRYEMLVRSLRPVLPEIEAFHKDLYVVYHTSLPNKTWGDVRAAAPALATKAGAIAKAALPKRLEAKKVAFDAAAADLVAACKALETTANGTDDAALDGGVQAVHAKYQALEKIFD